MTPTELKAALEDGGHTVGTYQVSSGTKCPAVYTVSTFSVLETLVRRSPSVGEAARLINGARLEGGAIYWPLRYLDPEPAQETPDPKDHPLVTPALDAIALGWEQIQENTPLGVALTELKTAVSGFIEKKDT